MPLTAAQILWINLMTDGLPALALAFDRTPGVMQQPRRPAGEAWMYGRFEYELYRRATAATISYKG